jgi:hypothetical protein
MLIGLLSDTHDHADAMAAGLDAPRGQRAKYISKPSHGHLAGSAAGVGSRIAHAAGPIVALYLPPRRLDRRIFVGACALYFFILNSDKIFLISHTPARLFRADF